jgi:membrane-associated phospholipid phosphatase
VSWLESLNNSQLVSWRVLWLVLLRVCLPLPVFLALAILVGQHPQGLAWDVAILNTIHAAARPSLDIFAATLTNFGGFFGVLLIAVVIGLVLLYRQQWRSLLCLIITLLGTGILNLTTKALFHRPRPQLWDGILPHWGYAFPSGHAMASMSIVVIVIGLTWGSRWCWLAIFAGSIFVAAIAWTRLYLGAHYPSDILAGWLLALGWTISISLAVRQNLAKPIDFPQDAP